MILGYLTTPGFLAGYFAGQPASDAADGSVDGRTEQDRHHR